MDELGLESFSSKKQKEIVDKIPLAYKAKIENWPDYLSIKGINRFPDYLSIKEICDLLFPIPDHLSKPDDKSLHREWRAKSNIQSEKNKAFEKQLIDACKNPKGLSYKGDIKGWVYGGKITNRHPLARKGKPVSSPSGFKEVATEHFNPVLREQLRKQRPKTYKCGATNCTIHKAEFKRYFKSTEKWTMVINGLLAKWWTYDEGEKIKNTPKDKKRLSPESQQRLKDLSEYFKEGIGWNSPQEISVDEKGIYHFLYTVKELRNRMERWEKSRKTKRKNKAVLWNTKDMDRSMWNTDERRAICGCNKRGKSQASRNNLIKNKV